MNMLEKETIHFKTLSPIFIKGKDIDYGQSYVRRDKDTVYLVSTDNLAPFLYNFSGDDSLLKSFTEQLEVVIKKRIKEFNFKDFLSKNNIYDYPNNIAYTQALIDAKVFKSVIKMPQNHNFICDGLGRPYIPGSAVKGMIRTAIMYYMAKDHLQKNDTKVLKFINNFKNTLELFLEGNSQTNKRNDNRKKNEFSRELQQYLFQNHTIGLKPNDDFFRYIHISDSQPLTELFSSQAYLYNFAYNRYKQENINAVKNNNNGILIADNERLFVKIDEREFDFIERIYRKTYTQLIQHCNEKIIITEFGGDRTKIKAFEFTGEKVNNTTQSVIEKEKLAYQLNYRYDDNSNKTKWDINAFKGSFNIDITLDHFGLEEFRKKRYNIPFKSIPELMKVLGYFYDDLWTYEQNMVSLCENPKVDIDNLKTFYSGSVKNKCRMGWGSGMMSLTIDMLLSRIDMALLRDKLFHNRPDTPAPKTRRFITQSDQIVAPLGWLTWSLKL